MNSALLSELVTMHTYCRPMGSATEHAFIARYVATLPGAQRDIHGNYHVIIGDAPTVVFSCHTDTVHYADGFQRVSLSTSGLLSVITLQKHVDRRLTFAPFRRPDCLGADDTVGVFLCRQMVLHGIAGHYIFHYGEERGCIGSSALAKDTPELLDGRSIAIAFDRGGNGDVITHQMGQRCCSDDFALDLAIALGGEYCPCDRGVYTDTNEYTALVPECTNISVGYDHQHSERETLDTNHVGILLDRLLAIDWFSLPVVRDPDAWGDSDRWWPSDVATGSVTLAKVSSLTDKLDYDAHSYLDSWECLICSRMNRSYLETCTTCGEDKAESDTQRAFFNRAQSVQGCGCAYSRFGGHDSDCPLSLCADKVPSIPCGCTPIICRGVVCHAAECPLSLCPRAIDHKLQD